MRTSLGMSIQLPDIPVQCVCVRALIGDAHSFSDGWLTGLVIFGQGHHQSVFGQGHYGHHLWVSGGFSCWAARCLSVSYRWKTEFGWCKTLVYFTCKSLIKTPNVFIDCVIVCSWVLSLFEIMTGAACKYCLTCACFCCLCVGKLLDLCVCVFVSSVCPK